MSEAWQILSTLKDVNGIEGSFVITGQGQLAARDMMAMFTDDLLSDVAPRIARLTDAFANERSDVHACLIRYQDHCLVLRAMPFGTLCVLTRPEVNMPALKMGVNLAVRRLAPLLSRLPPPEAPEPMAVEQRRTSRSMTAVSVPVDPEADGASKPVRYWRGQVVKS